MTNHDRHYSVWRVEVRPKWQVDGRLLSARTRFKAMPPTDPSNPGADPFYVFDTFAEAMNFAVDEAFKAWMVAQLSDWLDSGPKAVYEMRRLMTWWGEPKLGDLLSNI